MPSARLFFQKKKILRIWQRFLFFFGSLVGFFQGFFRLTSNFNGEDKAKFADPPWRKSIKIKVCLRAWIAQVFPPKKRTPVLLHVDMIESSRMIDKIRWILIGHFFVLFPWVLFVWKVENGVQQNRSLDNYRGSFIWNC